MTDPSRAVRRALVVLVAAMVLASCGGSSKKASSSAASKAAPPGSMNALAKGRTEYSLVQAQESLPVGKSRFVFGLIPQGGQPKVGGSPLVYVAKKPTDKPLGPFHATWQAFSPPKGDALGTPPFPGFFVTDVDIPSAGYWGFLATDTDNGKPIGGTAGMQVKDQVVAAIGSKAISEPTPVATTADEAAKIDTRTPPSPMHYISLDAALQSGKPTVLVFATPLLCQSRLCGPVVDEVLGVYDQVGVAKANFVDVEIYPERDANKPTEAFTKWGFQSEPWVLVIDKDGVIRGRFEGPSTAGEISAALQPLLST
ncbi:MAG TPA: thioredoxin family protein [Acidimicrobiales bacterium]|nr:thioredoxin family protein [Acidimicrobiales bacterium]